MNNHQGRRRTPDALLRNSCSVTGGGMIIGLSTSLGTLLGRGSEARTANLASIMSFGLRIGETSWSHMS